MISTEKNQNDRDIVTIVYTNDNGGHLLKTGTPGFVADDLTGFVSYNVGFGSTVPRGTKVKWNARQFDAAGISTAAFDPTTPDQVELVEINVPRGNTKTVQLYSGNNIPMTDLYEKTDDRKARHKALRDAGHHPPFPRADKFLKNIHLLNKQVGLSTEGSYTP